MLPDVGGEQCPHPVLRVAGDVLCRHVDQVGVGIPDEATIGGGGGGEQGHRCLRVRDVDGGVDRLEVEGVRGGSVRLGTFHPSRGGARVVEPVVEHQDGAPAERRQLRLRGGAVEQCGQVPLRRDDDLGAPLWVSGVGQAVIHVDQVAGPPVHAVLHRGRQEQRAGAFRVVPPRVWGCSRGAEGDHLVRARRLGQRGQRRVADRSAERHPHRPGRHLGDVGVLDLPGQGAHTDQHDTREHGGADQDHRDRRGPRRRARRRARAQPRH